MAQEAGQIQRSNRDNQHRIIQEADSPSDSGLIPVKTWSDKLLLDSAQNIQIPASIRNLKVQKSTLSVFFTFYAEGILPEETQPHQLIYPILCNLQNCLDLEEGTYLFPNTKLSANGFFNPVHLSAGNNYKYSLPQHYKPLDCDFGQNMTIKQRSELAKVYLTYPEISDGKFFKNIKKCIDKFDGEKITLEFRRVSRLAGYLCLIIFRCVSKNYGQISRAFMNRNIIKNLHEFTKWPNAHGYSPPCKKSIELCLRDMKKANKNVTEMFVLLLGACTQFKKNNTLPKYILPQIQTGLLAATAGNGMGLVDLMHNAQAALKTSIAEIKNFSTNSRSRESWEILENFIKKYQNEKNPEYSYLWARIIDDDYFIDLAAEHNAFLCGVFAGIVGRIEKNRNFTKAIWYKQQSSNAELGVKLGDALAVTHQR